MNSLWFSIMNSPRVWFLIAMKLVDENLLQISLILTNSTDICAFRNAEKMIREARPEDAAAMLSLIKELAVYENEPDAVLIDENTLVREGFSERPLFKCFVAEAEGNVVGMALVYFRFSTWAGKGLYLEDLIVKEEFRGLGLGKKLLDQVIRYGHQQDVGRIDWVVLDWNESAIEFYKGVGANLLTDWYIAQMDRAAIGNYIEKNAGI